MQYEPNDDVAEEFKMKSFVSMVSKCKQVLIPYFSSHQRKVEFSPMNIEHWPLIQAYALEGFGRFVIFIFTNFGVCVFINFYYIVVR